MLVNDIIVIPRLRRRIFLPIPASISNNIISDRRSRRRRIQLPSFQPPSSDSEDIELETSRNTARSRARRETRTATAFPTPQNMAQRRTRNQAIGAIPIRRSQRCWRANPRKLQGFYKRCLEITSGNNGESLHYCSMSGCHNRMCINNDLCCRKDPRETEESEDTFPVSGRFLCIPCFQLEMERQLLNVDNMSSQESNTNGAQHNINNASNAQEGNNMPSQDNNTNDVQHNNTSKEDLFKKNAEKLRLQLNKLKKEKLIKKNITVTFLKPSNNKFHMNSICKSLWNIVLHLKEDNVVQHLTQDKVITLERIIVEIEQLINYALELQSAKSNICFGIDSGDRCVICLDNFTSAKTSTTLACGHKYHDKCLKRMMQNRRGNVCAICLETIQYETIDL